jgi:imidazolonepropionase-like amidohydrolase
VQPQFTQEEKAIVSTAGLWNASCCLAHGDEGMQRATKGESKTIEHGEMSDATMDLMIKYNAFTSLRCL